MSEITIHRPDTEAVDWQALADEVFPADALRTVQTAVWAGPAR
jgi:hypothetical protein